EVAGEEFIALKPGFSLRTVTEELCAEAGFVPNIAFEGEEVETLRGLASAGLGVALLPETRRRVNAPHLRVTDVRASREIGLVWLKDRALPPASADFRDHVLENSRRIHVSDA